MEIKQNPFSIYDILGYLIPGTVFMYAAAIIMNHASATLLNEIKEKIPLSNEASIYILLALISYITGHLLSFISAMTIERYSLWAHGYPSKYLLRIDQGGYLEINKNKPQITALRIITAILLAPISSIDWLLGKIPGIRELYAKPLDEELIKILKAKIQKLLTTHAKISPPDATKIINDGDFFRYVYHYATENAPNHNLKMKNYVALYGFLRTITLISLITFWIITAHIIPTKIDCTTKALYITALSFFTFTLFMGFIKFYRRFSLEALMAMAVTYQTTPKTTK